MAEQTQRSLKLSAEEQVKANNALSKFGSKSDLAAQLKMSRTTINNFFKGEPVQRKQFHAICKKLKLDWQPESPKQPLTDFSNLDALVLDIRDRIRPIIQERCGTMRVLDMNQPIGLDDIYTHVNILEKITGRKRLELSELLQDVSPEEFDRFSLGNVKEQRVPGLKAIEKHGKLMILGKPGAGKTTFLKHLAIQCIGGALQADRVPIFITLKDFAETEGQPNLLAYIDSLISSTAGVNSCSTLQTQTPIQQILNNGRALILLDGLDEVRETDDSRILCQIQQFSDRYSHNAFVITCRIAAREYTFQQFTEVEVADFDDAQIADFSSKWFHCKQDAVKGDRFVQKLKQNPPIRELASSPLLLTLLCLVFEDSGDFPANRAELYEDAMKVLLKKWDTTRNIERDQIYKKLSLKRKEGLFSQIAYHTFEAGNYFFKQKDLARQIRDFIQNLPGASTDEQVLELDSEAVLKSIEAQHGLFVERAYGIYSFSHLTFHEYFAARYVVAKCNPSSMEDLTLNKLVCHLTDKRWCEVFLLTVEMLPEANVILRLMKQMTDQSFAKHIKMQKLLEWVKNKSTLIKISLKQSEVRFFYFQQAKNYSQLKIDISCLFRYSVFDLALHNFSLKPMLHFLNIIIAKFPDKKDLHLTHEYDGQLDPIFKKIIGINIREPAKNFDFIIHLQSGTIFYIKRDSERRIRNWFMGTSFCLPNEAEISFKEDLMNACNANFLESLNALIKELDNFFHNDSKQLTLWLEKYNNFLIEHQNIGHDWCFSEDERTELEKYHTTNRLLIDCLNSECYVSHSVREEIEETLLLPNAEIEKRKREKAQ